MICCIAQGIESIIYNKFKWSMSSTQWLSHSVIHLNQGVNQLYISKKKKEKEKLRKDKTWRKPRHILLSEGSHSEKTMYCRGPTIQRSGRGKTRRLRSGCRGSEREGRMSRQSVEDV